MRIPVFIASVHILYNGWLDFGFCYFSITNLDICNVFFYFKLALYCKAHIPLKNGFALGA